MWLAIYNVVEKTLSNQLIKFLLPVKTHLFRNLGTWRTIYNTYVNKTDKL